MSEGIWTLRADPEVLDGAGRAWGALRDRLDEVNEDAADAGMRALSEWTGGASEQFGARRQAILGDLDVGSGHCGAAAAALAGAAESVRSAQRQLDDLWAGVSGLPWGATSGGGVTFQVADEAEQATVDAAVAAAHEVRAVLDGELAVRGAELAAAEAGLRGISTAWEPVLAGTEVFVADLPPVPDVGIRYVDGEIVITTGDGDEYVSVAEEAGTGKLVVTIRRFVPEPAPGSWVDVGQYRLPSDSDVTIRGGGGNDIIELPPNADIRFTVVGGDGDDAITGTGRSDTIIGGAGDDEVGASWGDEVEEERRGAGPDYLPENSVGAGAGVDYVSGGAGRDYVDGGADGDWILGGRDRDTLYGSGGLDRISGGSGGDYLEGGEGADRITGEDGNDQLSGGRGDDRVSGGAGDDIAYGGQGSDRVLGGSGTDTTYDDAAAPGSEAENAITIEVTMDTSRIDIVGSDEFVARVQADLDMLAASPTGRQMLANLQNGMTEDGTTLVIQELSPDDVGQNNNYANQGDPHRVTYQPGNATGSTGDRPPVVGLYHELAHVYSYVNGNVDRDPYVGTDTGDNGISIAERQATGLPINHDNDSVTPEIPDPDQPRVFTENGLRDELGLDPRDHYRSAP